MTSIFCSLDAQPATSDNELPREAGRSERAEANSSLPHALLPGASAITQAPTAAASAKDRDRLIRAAQVNIHCLICLVSIIYSRSGAIKDATTHACLFYAAVMITCARLAGRIMTLTSCTTWRFCRLRRTWMPDGHRRYRRPGRIPLVCIRSPHGAGTTMRSLVSVLCEFNFFFGLLCGGSDGRIY